MTTVLSRFDRAGLPVLPVVGDEDRLLGVIDLEEIHLAAQASYAQPLILAEDLMRTDVQPLHLDDQLDRAFELFVENDLLALPVVDDDQQRHILGVIRRFDIANAYVRYVHGAAGRRR